jgi:hypothetical protein
MAGFQADCGLVRLGEERPGNWLGDVDDASCIASERIRFICISAT